MTKITVDKEATEDANRSVTLSAVLEGNTILFADKKTGMILTVNRAYYSVWRRSLTDYNKFVGAFSYDTGSRLRERNFWENSFGEITNKGREVFDLILNEYEEWAKQEYGDEYDEGE